MHDAKNTNFYSSLVKKSLNYLLNLKLQQLAIN